MVAVTCTSFVKHQNSKTVASVDHFSVCLNRNEFSMNLYRKFSRVRSDRIALHSNIGSSRNTNARSESESTVAAHSCLLLHKRSSQSLHIWIQFRFTKRKINLTYK